MRFYRKLELGVFLFVSFLIFLTFPLIFPELALSKAGGSSPQQANTQNIKKEKDLSTLADTASRIRQTLALIKSQQLNINTRAYGRKKRINRPNNQLAKLQPVASRQRSNSLKGSLPNLEVHFNKKNGTAVFIKAQGLFSREDAVRMRPGSSSPEGVALSCLQSYRDLLKVQNASEEFSQKKEIADARGLRHIKFQQVYKGIPLWGKEVIVHLDKKDAVYLVEGRIEPTPDLDVKPKISQEEALERVRRDFDKSGGSPPGDFPSCGLVIHTDGLGIARLAYQVTAYKGHEQWQYFVDAKTGHIVEKYNDTRYESVPGRGIDLFGHQQNFSVWKQGSTYSLIDTSASNGFDRGNIAILDAKEMDVKKVSIAAFSFVTSTSPYQGWDTLGVTLLHHLTVINNYFKNTFDRNSIDGQGLNNIGIIHVGQDWQNACWESGTRTMYFGDGGVKFFPLAKGLDIVAHEFTHGITQYTANLKYQYQSGALNEAFSDIFASMIDRNWLVGEDIVKVPPSFLRSLSNPHEGLASHPASMDEYKSLPCTEDGDYGGVHINCGIPGRAAYLMADGLSQEGYGTSIGRNKTEQIFYRALTQHLTPESDFYDCRRATIQSAEELYGGNSAEVRAAATAWDVVGVLGEEGTGGKSGGTVEPIKGGDNLLYIFHESDVPYLAIRLTNGEEYYVSDTPVAETRPVVVVNGEKVLFVDVRHDLRIASLSPDSTDEDVIPTEGLVRTIAGSHDGRYFAITTNPEDNLLYLLDMEKEDVQVFKLDWPNDADIYTNSLLYADDMDFDLPGNRIIFDAFSELKFSEWEGGYSFWNIGILDIRTGKIEMLVPTMPAGYHIYTPSASAVKDWLIAFEIYHEPTESQATVIYNLITRQASIIAEETGSPAFNGDDTFLALEYDGGIVKVPIQEQDDGSFISDFNRREIVGTGDRCLYPRYYRVGQRVVEPHIRIPVNVLDLGRVNVGQITTKTLRISNVGTYDLTIDSFQMTDEQNFRHRGSHTSIAAGNAMDLQVSFTPKNTGTKSATLSVLTDDPDTPRVDVTLRGEGIQNQETTGRGSGSNGSSGGSGGCFITTIFRCLTK